MPELLKPLPDQPTVGCVCSTFGRVTTERDVRWVINETVQCFHDQDYPKKVLYILNDTPGQPIVYNHPDVRVINYPARFPTLGTKRNAAVQSAYGCDLLCVWDDDNISFPWRISTAVTEFLQSDPQTGYLAERVFWFSTHNSKYKLETYGRHGLTASAFYRRDVALDVPHQERIESDEDLLLYADIERAGYKIASYIRPAEQAALIYRWAFDVRHLSGFGPSGYEVLGRQKFPQVPVAIRPKLTQDYVAVTRDKLRTGDYQVQG
jgi:hypothetical protein